MTATLDSHHCRALAQGLSVWQGQAGHAYDLAGKHALLSQQRALKPISPRRRKTLQDILGIGSGMSMAALVARLPCGKTEEDKLARSELFDKFDPERKGELSGHEVGAGLRSLLDERGEPEPAPMAAIEAAFKSITRFMEPGTTHLGRPHFRQILVHVKWYLTSPKSLQVAQRPQTASHARPQLSPPRARSVRRPVTAARRG